MAKKKVNREERQRMMLEDPLIRVVPSIAIPMIISSIIDSIYNLADTFFVSGLGQNATAAVAVNDSLMQIIRAVGMGFAMGAASYISRLMGAKEDEKASRVATTTLFIGCMAGILLAAGCYPFKGPLVLGLGSTEESMSYSMDYAKWILLAAPFTIANTILNQLLRSEGSSTLAMVGMTSGCVLNCALDPLFISVLGLKVEGAALATAISKVFSFSMLILPYIRKTALLTLSAKNFRPEKEAASEVAKMGVPAFIRMTLMSTGGIVTNNVAKGFGTATLAGIAIANKLNRFVGAFIMGFSQGLAPIAGFCWGARRYKRTKKAFCVTVVMQWIASGLIGLIMIIFAEQIVGVFNSEGDPQVIAIGCLKLRSLCIAFIPHVLVMVTSNLFQAIGRPVENLILSMSRQLICLIPLVLIIPRFFGAEGLACCQALADTVSGLLLAVPMLIFLMKKINSLNDGDEQPFGKTGQAR